MLFLINLITGIFFKLILFHTLKTNHGAELRFCTNVYSPNNFMKIHTQLLSNPAER